MPPGRVPGPPESLLARQGRGRRISFFSRPAAEEETPEAGAVVGAKLLRTVPPSERLMMAPFDGPDELHIVLARNVVKNDCADLAASSPLPLRERVASMSASEMRAG
jgi:hypothetical protein